MPERHDPRKETGLLMVGNIPPKTSRDTLEKGLEKLCNRSSGFEQLVYNPGSDHAILVFSSDQSK